MDDNEDLQYASFERFELELTMEQARMGSHQGDCDADVKFLLTLPSIKLQFDKIKPEDIRKELEGYGAWDDIELADDDQNKNRILWIACGNVLEDVAAMEEESKQ